MERPILLWVGRMETVKGLPVLLDAIQQLQKDGIDVQTVLVGAEQKPPRHRQQFSVVAFRDGSQCLAQCHTKNLRITIAPLT